MGKTESDLEMFEKSLDLIAREELNQFFESENENPGNKYEVLEEHLRNNILMESKSKSTPISRFYNTNFI